MLRSLQSNVRSFIKFSNHSRRFVEIYWINYKGEKIHYANLDPGQSYTVNSFVTHPWIFTCTKTGERLWGNSNEVFQPEAWFKFIINAANGVVTTGRQEVIITYPLKSLRDICLWNAIFMINSRDDIYDLEIPKSLKEELFECYKKSSRWTGDDEETETDDMGEQMDDRYIM